MKLNRAVAAFTALTMAIAPGAAPIAAAAAAGLSLGPSRSVAPAATNCDHTPKTITAAPITAALARVNQYRALAGMAPATENKTWSKGDRLHARYSVKNDILMHDEDPANVWCSPAGRLAAQMGNVAGSFLTSTTDSENVDQWMQGPFHAVGVIDAALTKVGFGSYRESHPGHFSEAAVLDVLRGSQTLPAGVHYPVKYPSGTKALPIRTDQTGEIPDPLTAPSCSGYALPTGVPIILQLGHYGSASGTISVSAYSLKLNGVAQAVCEIDETNYTNPSYQDLGRGVLQERDAIALIPKHPLHAGKTYTVSITNSGHTYTWSFKVAANAQ
jgi:uncharacterized protein YkwD